MQTKSADHLNWGVHLTVEKFFDDEAYQRGGVPDEIVERYGNLLLNAGITLLLNLLIGAGGQAFTVAGPHSRIAVGDNNGSTTNNAVASQTDLQAASNRAYKTVDATYPQVSAQTVTWRSTFSTGTAAANFAWNEWGVDNGTVDATTIGSATMLNRKVENPSLGTKTTGTWVLTVNISVS